MEHEGNNNANKTADRAKHQQSFADRLQHRIDMLGNPTCMGLDPMLSYIPGSFSDAIYKKYGVLGDEQLYYLLTGYCFVLIEAVHDIVPAIKPQLAYFEQYGAAGIAALQAIIMYAKQYGMLVILDGKRNDIGSTATAYSNAYLGKTIMVDGKSEESLFGADALTVNGYLGTDGIRPFLDACEAEGKGIFVLCRTSNHTAGELQDLDLSDGRKVYEAMADMIHSWGEAHIGSNGLSSVGAVVGATWPEQARALRKRMPNNFFLIPGFGAQGGTAKDAVAGFNSAGKGAIVNASRSLMLAWKKHEMPQDKFAQATRKEAISMREKLQEALQ